MKDGRGEGIEHASAMAAAVIEDGGTVTGLFGDGPEPVPF